MALPIVRPFHAVIPIFEEANQFIAGVTRDSAGAPLGNCTVYVFRMDFLPRLQPQIEGLGPGGSNKRATSEQVRQGTTYEATVVSDGSGNFSAGPFLRNSGPYFMVAWDAAGAVAGVTVQTLQPPA